MRPGLWTCPSCGRQFANTNQTHSCGDPGLDAILAGHDEKIAAIYETVTAALAEAGEFRTHPQKTRIAFITRMTFASVRLARSWVDLSLILPSAISDHRIRRIDMYGPTSLAHEVRLHRPEDVDDDVTSWLSRARRRGDQEEMDRQPGQVGGLGREVLRIPLRGEVVDAGDRLGLRIPRYAANALGPGALAVVRVAKEDLPGRIVSGEDRQAVTLDGPTTAFQAGDTVEFTLSARVDQS